MAQNGNGGNIIQALPLLCQRGVFNYVEVYESSDEGKTIKMVDFYADKATRALATVVAQRPQPPQFAAGEGFPGRALLTKTAVLFKDVPESDIGVHQDAQSAFKSGLAIPVSGGHAHAISHVLAFFSQSEQDLPENDIVHFINYANALVTSGLFTEDEANVKFATFPGVSDAQVTNVFKTLAAEGDFSAKHIYQEVDLFYRMGIPNVYFRMFDDAQIAAHIKSLMAAKKFAQSMGQPEDIFVKHQDEGHMFWIVPATYAHSVKVETEIESVIAKTPEGCSFSLAYMYTKNPFLPRGTHLLSMYYVDQPPYPEAKVDHDEINLARVASASFIKGRSNEVQARYRSILEASRGLFKPVIRIDEAAADGFTPVAVALHHDERYSFLLKFTEVLRYHKVKCSRKFIQTFANGLVVYTFYLATTDAKFLANFTREIQDLTLVPGSSMKNLFLNGSLTVEEYSYAACIRKFIYYFLNQKNDDLEALTAALKNDPMNLARLKMLNIRLHREAVSRDRITQAMIDETALIPKVYQDFVRCCNEGPSYNQDLHNQIGKTTQNELNAQIFRAFLVFNSKLLKTNFFKPSKAALSFSLDASFLEAASYPENPYVIFFVIAQEFQGFHVRFRDVSRGGIRVIKSANQQAFQRNLQGQFAETYDLSHTQNRKNKDIPEFGSKGTILLFREAQANVKVAFKKYVSALLDLLVIEPGDGIVDHYKKPELLFLGPDENSADLMEWAARYAQFRGYRYWKSFTTGKPPAIGGIPHDTYGMTTSGVHSYTVSVLEKMGLKEEECTKFQTGGPDGDLGSNEILISKDKTIAIVDGSGVIYDPLGLNRAELVRLAKARIMISNFDLSLLNPGGFRVLVTDKDIVLPTGEKVESGLVFRNEFQFHPLSKADLFVPCGGRPAAISLNDVKRTFVNGAPKWKIVVEGANLFLTQDARLVLEEAGVVLYKDASANKGGVTSSSLEVLAALAMSDSEHETHMQVKDPNAIPPFYLEYVKEVKQIIGNNARLEFECIWREHLRTGTPRAILTDKVSEKINQLTDACGASTLYENLQLRQVVMADSIPKKLQELVPLNDIISRLPDNYARSIFATYLAARFVYKYGLNAHDFAFFEFVTSILEKK